MHTSRLLAVIAIVASASLAGAPLVRAQSIAAPVTNMNVTLKTFTPVDSVFPNPKASTFEIALLNTISGTATEYRVSRFADFRDATWRAYSTRLILNVQKSWFPTASKGEAQITLYFQVRNKNPLAGRIASVVNGRTEVQPDFLFSSVLEHAIRLIYFG